MIRTMPSYYISHGGGPWPWMEERRQVFARLEASLAAIPAQLPARPAAVLMLSGHWEEPDFAVMHGERPAMLYDYYNFPAHTYEVQYPAPGAPALAERVAAMIRAAGLPTHLDDSRGFDHGVFVPMAVMYPDADMPLFQVSIRADYDPVAHLALGRALAPLRDDGVLIVGSGFSYHNLRNFGPGAAEPSAAFDAWLSETMALSPEARTRALSAWENAPAARAAHAQEDHLVPLFAAVGAAEDAPASRVYHEQGLLGGVTASSFRFG